jgi:hypothetical protein
MSHCRSFWSSPSAEALKQLDSSSKGLSGDEADDLGRLALAANKAGELDAQVIWTKGERCQRRDFAGHRQGRA